MALTVSIKILTPPLNGGSLEHEAGVCERDFLSIVRLSCETLWNLFWTSFVCFRERKTHPDYTLGLNIGRQLSLLLMEYAVRVEKTAGLLAITQYKTEWNLVGKAKRSIKPNTVRVDEGLKLPTLLCRMSSRRGTINARKTRMKVMMIS